MNQTNFESYLIGPLELLHPYLRELPSYLHLIPF